MPVAPAGDPRPLPRGDAYTDAPRLHPGLLLGTLQIVFWLLFRPTAWRKHVAGVDPTLAPDFCLAELSLAQAKNPALRRLVLRGHLVWPLLVGLLLAVQTWPDADSRPDIGARLAVGVIVGMASVLGVSLVVSVAVSLLAGMVVLVGSMTFAGGDLIDVTLSGGWPSLFLFCTSVGVMFGVAAGLGYKRTSHTLTRQVEGLLAGAVICAAAIALAGVQSGPALLLGAFGWAVAQRVHGWRRGLVFGLANVLVFYLAYAGAHFIGGQRAALMLMNLEKVMICVVWLGLPYALATGIGGPRAGAGAGTLGCAGGWLVLVIHHTIHHAHVAGPHSLSPRQIAFVGILGMVMGLSHSLWRPGLLYPLLLGWNYLIYRLDEQRQPGSKSLLGWNAAFWDEYQRLPLYGLDEHLLMVLYRNRPEGQRAMARLALGPQRWAARAAQIEMDARKLEVCADVDDIVQAHEDLMQVTLNGPLSTLLRSLARASQDVEAAGAQDSVYNQRLALSAVEDRLDGLERELVRSSEPYAARFLPIAIGWRSIIWHKMRALTEAAEARQDIASPYVLGVPLTEKQEIFVGRADVCARIEQLVLDVSGPPLLLYGQRRMGKTSLLNNLGRLLPSTIVPMFVDLQGPAARSSDHAGLLYNLARGIGESAQRHRDLHLPPLARAELASDPFTRFDEWLDQVEQALGSDTALLALDEFGVLESALAEGRFHEGQVLGMLRHLIQHRRRIQVLLAGSHTMDEMQRFASYLINVQAVKIGYLHEPEARQLIEHPTRDFALRYEPEASQRVLDVTRGHPFLVQLLCAEIVACKNEQPPAVRRLARLSDVEQAIPEAISHGSFFFADIERNQVDRDGLSLLVYLAAQGEGTGASREDLDRRGPGDLGRVVGQLLRRDLIEPVGEGYRFQVELIRRWFVQRHN